MPLLPGSVLPSRSPACPDPDGSYFPPNHREQLDSIHHGGTSHGVETKVQKAIFGWRDVSEDALIGDIRAGRVSHDVKRTQNEISVDGNPEKALAFATGLGADEISQSRFGKMKMQFVLTGCQRDVVPKVAAPQMAVNIGVQRPQDSFGWTDEHIASREKPVWRPCSPAAILVGIGCARNHPKLSADRCS